MRKRGSDDFGQGKKDGEEIRWERGGEIYVSVRKEEPSSMCVV